MKEARQILTIERFEDYYEAIAFINTYYTMLDIKYEKKSLKVVLRYCTFINMWTVEIYGRKAERK